MSDIGWDESLEIGIGELDADHRRLFAMLDEFSRLAQKGAPTAKLLEHLHEIRAFFLAHIHKEDRIMSQFTSNLSLDHKEKHEQEHGTYVYVLDQVRGMLETDQWKSAQDNMNDLKKLMFFRELVKTDYEMVRCMIQEGLMVPA
ncbi:hypothetical protein JCM17960_03700 [Magnetospira thiophila]